MKAADQLSVAARHIQNQSEASSLEPHWGYADRVVPCTNDAGSCEYLDNVYWSHDIGMIYMGILWCTVGGILLVWAVGRHLFPEKRADQQLRTSIDDQESSVTAPRNGLARLRQTLDSYRRAYLLPESVRSIFGPTTRLQVLILAVLSAYLIIWTFVGIAYKKWITPVKNSPGLFNIRSGLGPFSDRIGVIAYALTPLSIILSSRESILSLITGVPYQSFNFLHRWLGYIIVIQGSVHTIGWCVVEIRLYQPQPSTAITWIKQLYMIWGVVAMILLLLLFLLSTKWGIRLTGYETFRKLHYILAMVYIGACWGHWKQLECFLIPSLAIWLLDRAIRLVRSALIHYQFLPDGSMGFRAAPASIVHFPDPESGDVVRMDFRHSQEAWNVGQHFYLCFTESSKWQSHPFTPLSYPIVQNGTVLHSYIFRAKSGETKKIAALTAAKVAEDELATTPVILQGPYGESLMENLTPDVNVLCVAGGTGITYVLPVLLGLVQTAPAANRCVELIWAIRKESDVKWVDQELRILQAAAKTHNLKLRVFVTREEAPASPARTGKAKEVTEESKEVGSSASSSVSRERIATEPLEVEVQHLRRDGQNSHPDLKQIVTRFVEGTVRGRTTVYASGPAAMISDLRSIVAACNSGSKVWKGENRYDVSLMADDRLEW
ncbi:unnamed protein product [Clonostachys rosea]|uniref:FAD-binding FR-type domain-containing protein n=1 Tax=Bionectria ochroleuca TaxID=29856 RepID=A0ABY6UJ43_BIOOC|nr:unnamed protein product [Clonostachys rosea]